MRRTNTHNLSNGSSRLRSPPSFPSRLPSEDCVPDPEPPGALNGRGGFENRGVDEDAEPTSLAISAVTGSTLPPIQGGYSLLLLLETYPFHICGNLLGSIELVII